MPIDTKNELAFAYKAIKLLTTDYEDMDAFEDGIIDSEGNRIVPHWSGLPQSEYKHYNIFTRLILILKQVMEKLPANLKKRIRYHQLIKTLREEVESISDKESSLEYIYQLNDALLSNFNEEQHACITDHMVSAILEDKPLFESSSFVADCAEMELFEFYESMSVGGGIATGGGTGSGLAGVSDAQVDPNKNTIVNKKKRKDNENDEEDDDEEKIRKNKQKKIRKIIDRL